MQQITFVKNCKYVLILTIKYYDGINLRFVYKASKSIKHHKVPHSNGCLYTSLASCTVKILLDANHIDITFTGVVIYGFRSISQMEHHFIVHG